MIRRLILVLLIALAPTPAFAWWEYGHQTVAAIAWLNVSPRTRAEIDRLLRQARLLETPTCPARTIEQAAVWPDCIKTLGDRFSYASSWHYADVDICHPFDPTPACRDGNCVIAQIERNLRLLANRSLPVRERIFALAFVVHLVGDLHQPLHVGEHGDSGGNQINARYGAIGGRLNLHSIWDGLLAERAISSPPGGPRGILGQYSQAEIAAMGEGNVEDWARETWQLSHDDVYALVFANPCRGKQTGPVTVDEAMTQKLIPAVRLQIARGGVRLAKLLNETLG
jgi:hypothetical protein